jgi:hypothetical protein
MQAEVIRDRVRRALADGALPPLDGTRTWAGRGTGRACRVCGQPIEADQVEHEILEPESALVHRACLAIWREESTRIQRG